MTATTLAEKTHAYCDINDMIYPERLDAPSYDLLADIRYSTCYAWNTQNFLVYGLWQLAHGVIDDVQFFQIGDLAMAPGISEDEGDAPLHIVNDAPAAPLKQARPHLDACDQIAAHCEDNALYVIDYAAKVAYEHRSSADARDALMHDVASHQSAVLCI